MLRTPRAIDLLTEALGDVVRGNLMVAKVQEGLGRPLTDAERAEVLYAGTHCPESVEGIYNRLIAWRDHG